MLTAPEKKHVDFTGLKIKEEILKNEIKAAQAKLAEVQARVAAMMSSDGLSLCSDCGPSTCSRVLIT